MFHNNIVEISEKLNNRNLLIICLEVIHHTDFCIICIPFHYWGVGVGREGGRVGGGVRKAKIFEKPRTRILCIGSYDKRFCIK